MSTSTLYPNQHVQPQSYHVVRIHGLQNSGTNLLTQYLQQHFTVFLDTPGWKHQMLTPSFCHRYPGFIDQRVLKIFIVKDPYFWLQSMYKSPYEVMSIQRPRNINDYARRPVKLTAERGGMVYRNPIQYWRIWYEKGIDLLHQYRMPLIVIRYEDLLFYPEQVMNELSTYLTKKGDWTSPRIIESAAKSHGASRNRTDALAYYHDERNRVKGLDMRAIELIERELTS